MASLVYSITFFYFCIPVARDKTYHIWMTSSCFYFMQKKALQAMRIAKPESQTVNTPPVKRRKLALKTILHLQSIWAKVNYFFISSFFQQQVDILMNS